ncbi:MAG TPA: hypothetical protein PKC12_07690 [Thiobacillaceae bacterium]|nr:hypothetical protein [Thiobacillaceae bacterium]
MTQERNSAPRWRIFAPLLMAVALVLVAAAGYWLKQPAGAVQVACADPIAGCRFEHGGAPVLARFSIHPSPLEPFVITVGAAGVAHVSAEFQMVGMDMGFNRYDLRPGADGTFTSTVTLPICVSGRRDWKLYLELDGTRYELPFSTL